MGGCCDSTGGQRFYMITGAGIAKIVAAVAGSVPVILSFIMYDHYQRNLRPPSLSNIRIPSSRREAWEMAFLIVVCASLGITVINLILYTVCKCLSKNLWTKRFDCGYFALSGMAQMVVGFIMIGSALTSSHEEPVEMKWAAGFLGIVAGIVYWGAATLVNRDD